MKIIFCIKLTTIARCKWKRPSSTLHVNVELPRDGILREEMRKKCSKWFTLWIVTVEFAESTFWYFPQCGKYNLNFPHCGHYNVDFPLRGKNSLELSSNLDVKQYMFHNVPGEYRPVLAKNWFATESWKCRKSCYFCGRILARISSLQKVYDVFHVWNCPFLSCRATLYMVLTLSLWQLPSLGWSTSTGWSPSIGGSPPLCLLQSLWFIAFYRTVTLVIISEPITLIVDGHQFSWSKLSSATPG